MSHTGSWAWNLQTDAFYWSDEHYRICGLDPEEKPSFSSMQWIHPDDRAGVRATIERAIRDRSDCEFDYRALWKDGTIRLVRSLAHPLIDQSGVLNEYIGTVIDITEQTRAEESRKELVRRLLAAQEEERGRISRELHDDFGQRVSALALKLGALRREHGGNTNLDVQLASLEAIVKQLDSNVSVIAWQLRPAALDDFGFAAALTTYVERWSKYFGIHVTVDVSGTEGDRLTDERETALYRIMQEALNNVAKHAGARNVRIALHRSPA
jgi:PAS domain S-box-containing protein